MSTMEKSDSPVVVKKQANKAASAAAELVERRGEAKENANLQTTVRTQRSLWTLHSKSCYGAQQLWRTTWVCNSH